MLTAPEIIATMRTLVPPHKETLSLDEELVLRGLTKELSKAKPEAVIEYYRFLLIQHRALLVPEIRLFEKLCGATVLVTGGTGCVGSELMAQIAKYQPARLVGISRGLLKAYPRLDGAIYMIGDVRDRRSISRLIKAVKPDVIFHLAAQYSPALAEVEVHRTVMTNVFGTRNVLASALEHHVPQVVCASTGKALRPYSPEVYTASKRAAEWLADDAVNAELLVSAARFTHVIDNSLFYKRLTQWAIMENSVVRLHDPDIHFYVQSAKESAQLLLLAMLGAKPYEFRIHAIRDLDWPLSLLDITLGTLKANQSTVPIYISGYDPGYEEVSFPGLYDPATAGDVSPLINAFEVAAMVDSPRPASVDAFDLKMAHDATSEKYLTGLDEVCAHTEDPWIIRRVLDTLSWGLLDATLAAVPVDVLRRTVNLIQPHESTMSPTHRRINKALRLYAEME
jgi:nucleoside-diphosphate-sugar epimerase